MQLKSVVANEGVPCAPFICGGVVGKAELWLTFAGERGTLEVVPRSLGVSNPDWATQEQPL
jgi:hypothetical protein